MQAARSPSAAAGTSEAAAAWAARSSGAASVLEEGGPSASWGATAPAGAYSASGH